MQNTERTRGSSAYFLIASASLMVAGFVILLYRIIATNAVSWLFIVVPFLALFGLIALGVGSLRSGRARIPISIIMLILGIAAIFGSVALAKVNNTMNKISISGDAATEVTQVSAVVLKEDKAETLDDVDGYKIGYLNQKGSEDMLKLIDEATGRNQHSDKFDGPAELVEALLDKSIELAVINHAYIDIISEQEGYEDFADKIKILKTIQIEEELKTSGSITDRDQFLIYVSGIDTFGSVNTRSRSDVNILVAVNKKTGQIRMVNTPRDAYVTLGSGINQKDKLTHAGVFGIDCSMETLENLYGVDIDYYLRMNFSGFEQIIDSIGGIDVYSDSDFTVEPVKHYTVGINHLNGVEALAFARERKTFSEGDVKRGEHQMAVVKAMIQKLSSRDALLNYQQVLDDVSGSFETDIPTSELYKLAMQQIQKGTDWNIDSYTVRGTGMYTYGYAMPGWNLYMMDLDPNAVSEASSLIKNTLGEE